ncbi:unnamed protein product [Moneuplotes crassus]|uniref:Uncharacterized protein n=1 Tax=Euplotes crassus TaxID=5936 RepID=A0AAD1XBK1_EUPCR|nr:unnamed protein product [Moneuplotes crassus]
MYDFGKDNEAKLSTQIQEKYLSKKYKSSQNFLKMQSLGRPLTGASRSKGRKKRPKDRVNSDIFNQLEAPNIDNLFPKSSEKRTSKISFTKSRIQVSKPDSTLGHSEIAQSHQYETEQDEDFKRNSSVDNKRSTVSGSLGHTYGLDPFKNAMRKSKKMYKDPPSIINSKIIEHWMNETLGDAEHLNIPGVLMKPENKVPVARYNIDRMTLMKGGIPNESVNRIYRSLFVYSVGFYDLIVRCMEHSSHNHSLVSSIWKVFAILIEYCCKTDYTMLISRLAVEHKNELDKANANFAEKCDKFAELEEVLRQNITDLENDTKTYKEKVQNYEEKHQNLLEIVEENIENREKEVKLRVQFEDKINNMHALNRETETQYQRAVGDIEFLEKHNVQLREINKNLSSQVKELKSIKEDQESTIKYDKGRIKSLTHENDIGKRNNMELEDKIAISQEKLNECFSTLCAKENEMEKLKLSIDKYASIEKGLIKERDYYKLNHDRMEERNSSLDERLKTLKQEFDNLKQENIDKEKKIIEQNQKLLSYEENFKRQLEKIERLDKEIDVLDQENQTLSENNRTYKQLNEEQKKELDEATSNMKKVNDERNHSNELLESANSKIATFIQQIHAKEEMIAVLEREKEKLRTKLDQAERLHDVLEKKKDNAERILEIERMDLNDQIKIHSTQIESEIEAREKWIERYETEYKAHLKTTSEVMKLRTNVKELKHQNNYKKTELERLTDENNKLKDDFEEKRFHYSSTLKKLEETKRQLETTQGLLKLIEKQHEEYVTRLRVENMNLKENQKVKINILEMGNEDLRSTLAENEYRYKEMNHQAERDRVQLRITETSLREMTKERDNFKERFMQTYDQMTKLEEKLIQAQNEYDELLLKKNKIQQMNDRISMKNEDYRSFFFNYESKFKKLSNWEKEIIEKEKEVRAIKKRENPYEYVDFSDKFVQTCNPIRSKGINTDPIKFEDPVAKEKVKYRPSLVDSVTTALGGIAVQTDTMSDAEIVTPTDYLRSMRPRNPINFKNRPQSSQITGTTYSYNIRNGIIEEEDDPLGMTGISNASKDMFRTTSTMQLNNFQSPGSIRPTALQRHHQAYKVSKSKGREKKFSNILKNRAKTAMSINKRERRNIKTNNFTNIYTKTEEKVRPTTEQGVRKGTNHSATQSRSASHGPCLSKAGTQVSTTHKTHMSKKYKTSLRNLIKAASTRNQ